MKEVKCDDPVGFVIDVADPFGGLLVARIFSEENDIELERAEALLESQTNEYRKRGLTHLFVFAADWSSAEAVLLEHSPIGSESLSHARLRRPPGESPVIVIGDGGNICSFIAAGRPITDGQHRSGRIR